MSSLATIASSGLQAADLRLRVSAHNVANMNTPGFAPQRVSEASAGPRSGVTAQVVQSDQRGVSLEQEAIEQMAAKLTFKANVFVLRTYQETTGTLLNVFA